MVTHERVSALLTSGLIISGTQALLASVADSAAVEIRDDLIQQEVLYRRVDAGVRSDVNKRITQLGRDLKNLMFSIDVHGTSRKDARERRLKRLNTESRTMIRTAYSEIGGIMRAAVRRIAKVETKKATEVVRKHVP
jgi:hypothetical protein